MKAVTPESEDLLELRGPMIFGEEGRVIIDFGEDRLCLARQEGLVDAGAPARDDSIDGRRLAGGDLNEVAHLNRLNGCSIQRAVIRIDTSD